VLVYYDAKKPITISVDSSRNRVGPVPLQNQQAVAYASKVLTASELNYFQIKKEMLNVVLHITFVEEKL
jgi:hypothetical protein